MPPSQGDVSPAWIPQKLTRPRARAADRPACKCPIGTEKAYPIKAARILNVREIVREAKNSHGGDLPKCPQGPDLSGFIAGAARGIRTPDPVITNDVL
jgi:hypothetical protein